MITEMKKIRKTGRGTARRFASGFAIALSCLASGTLAIADEPTELKFGGSATWLGQVPIMVAIDNGYFEEEGIKVEFVPIGSSYDRLSALTSGSIDFSNLGRVAVISEMARGNDAFYNVANVDDSPGNEGCWARPGVESIADMRGRKVAANSSAEITMTLLLATEDMTQSDVELFNIGGTEMAPALARGDVDVACIWQPLLDGLKAAVPDGKLIGTDKDTSFYNEFGTMASPDIVIMSRELVNDSPEIANKVIKALFKGADFANNNPEEAAQVVSHYFNKDAADLVDSIDEFMYFGGSDWEAHMELHIGQMQALATLLYDLGKIGAKPDVTEWTNTSFITD